MKVLVTGATGRIGHYVTAALEEAGHDVVPFDLTLGGDVRDRAAVDTATRGIDAVVHLAALPVRAEVDDADVMATNVGGTWNVLSAAAANGVRRFVYASSVNALGIFRGLRKPDYLPIDDDHPCYATSAYGVSKHLGEELCTLATRTTGMPTISLRIPAVIEPHQYKTSVARGIENSTWEYGAFIDVRDLAQAIVRAIQTPLSGHERLLIASSDAMLHTPPTELVDQLYPGVPWPDRAEVEADASRPLVNAEPVRELLGWSPVYTWAANVISTPPPRRRSLPRRAVRKARAAWRARRR